MKKFISILLAIILSLNFLSVISVNASSFNTMSDFDISLNWTDSPDNSNLVWNATTSQNKVIRLNVNYSNHNTVSTSYEIGSLSIVVNGIGKLERTNTYMRATSIAADPEDSVTKEYDWSYSYNEITDMYTFTNNNVIDTSSVFAGSFELLWSLNPRNIKNSYIQEFTAILNNAATTKSSNTVSFTFHSVADTYSLAIEPEAVGEYRSLFATISNPSQYDWIKYKVTKNTTTKARGLNTSHYIIDPGANTVVSEPQYTSIENGLYMLNSGDNYFYITVGYLKDYYLDPETPRTAGVTVQYIGKVLDSLENEILATQSKTVSLASFSFIAGAELKHTVPNSIIKYDTLFDASEEMTFYLGGGTTSDYTTSIYDDFIDVRLNNGEYRQLSTHEYEFTTLTLPDKSAFYYDDGTEAADNQVLMEIYSLAPGDNDDDEWYNISAYIGSESGVLTLPQGTHQVRIDILNTRGSLLAGDLRSDTCVSFNVKFHLDDDSSLPYDERVSASGEIINSCRYVYYNNNGERVYSGRETDPGNGTLNQRMKDRDLALYGTLFTRSAVKVPVYILDNNYYFLDTSFNAFTNENNTLKSYESIKTFFNVNEISSEDATITSFTQYSILPKGVNIDLDTFDYGVQTSVSSIRLSNGEIITKVDDYIKSHVAVDIIENYKDSSQTYIVAHYNFTDNPLPVDTLTITLKFPIYVTMDSYLEFGANYTARAAMTLDGSSVPFFPSPEKDSNNRYTHSSVDNGSYFNDQVSLWNDINNDGDATKQLLYNYYSRTIVVAMAYYLDTQESAKTSLSNNSYVTEQALTHLGEPYSYKIKLRTGANDLKDVSFVTYLESSPDSHWQGTFQSIDISYLQNLGLTPVISYANTSDPSYFDWQNTVPDTVKAIKIEFNETVPKNSLLYATINMQAPTDTSLIDVVTGNEHTVSFKPINVISGDVEGEETLTSNIAQIKIVDNVGDLNITKTDAATTARLKNATFAIYKTVNGIPDEFICIIKSNATGTITVKNLDYGNYYLVETAAPMGYEGISTNIPFTIGPDSFTQGTTTVSVAVNNTKILGTAVLYKGNSAEEEIPVQGATYALYKSNNTLVQENLTTSEEGLITVNNLEWGSYYFIETSAAPGYHINNEQIPFDVDITNVSEPIRLTTTDVQKNASVVLTKYEKKTNGSPVISNAVSGAMYALYRVKNGTETIYRDRLVTDVNGQICVNGLIVGKYYFIEIIKATGYALNTDKIYFDITEVDCDDLSTVNVETFDVRVNGRAMLIKTDEDNNAVPNAVYTLYDENDDIYLDDITTDIEGHALIEDLPWGNYYLIEKTAPVGYKLSNTLISFSVTRTNCEGIQSIYAVNSMAKSSVELFKVDATDNTLFLEGAEFALYRDDGTMYGDGYVTDANGRILVEDLPWDSYYFLETSAPNGYVISDEKIRFSVNIVNAGTLLTVHAENKAETRSVTVTKRIYASDINWANGNPTFIYTLENYRSDPATPATNTYHTMIMFDSAYVSANVDADGCVEKTAVISDVDTIKYILREEKTLRYEVNNVTTPDNSAGTTFIEGDESPLSQKYGTGVYFDMSKFMLGEATFTNQKNNWGRASDAGAIINIINPARKLVGISAHSNFGPISVSSAAEIDKTGIDVYATYDDGSSVLLEDYEYTIINQNFATNIDATYTVQVQHNESGKTCTFQIKTDIRGLFIIDDTLGNNQCAIIGYLGLSPELAFPQVYDGMDVVQIGNGTDIVTGVENVTTMIIPDSVLLIKEMSFQSTYNLSTLSIPISAEIKENAFSYNPINSFTITKGTGIGTDYTEESYRWLPWMSWNSSYFTMTFSEGIKSIGNYQFYDSNITGTVAIPNSTTSIGQYAFASCYNITEIVVGENIKCIPNSCFYGCGSLRNVVLPIGLTTIGASAFESCYTLIYVNIPNSVTVIEERAFNGCSNLSEIVISGDVSCIPNNCFENCGQLSRVVLPAGMTEIGDLAFSWCSSLTDISLPDTITDIGDQAFAWTMQYSPEPISFTLPDSLLHIGDGAFMYAFSGAPEPYDLIVPDSVQIIGNGAFSSCNMLRTITIGNGIQTIGKRAFNDCYQLATVTIDRPYDSVAGAPWVDGTNIPTIGWNSDLFTDSATGLVFNTTATYAAVVGYTGTSGTVVIPSTYNGLPVTKIGIRAFCCEDGTNIITSITVPDSVTYISELAFANNTILTSFNFNDNITYYGAGAFMGCSALSSQLVFSTITPTILKSHAFYHCSSLTGTVSLNAISEIESSVFTNCSSLVFLFNFSNELKAIGMQAFAGCSGNGTGIVFPESLTSIGNDAFNTVQNVPSVTFGSGITTIPTGLFYNCSSLASVTFSDSITSINPNAFEGCAGITALELPAGIMNIGQYAFSGCSNITSPLVLPVSLGGYFGGLGTGAFMGCSKITSLTIESDITNPYFPQGLKTIPTNAFSGCSGIEGAVHIPNTVNSIDTSAFKNCSKITDIYIYNQTCLIANSTYTIPSAANIHGYTSSTAKTYATRYNRNFVTITE